MSVEITDPLLKDKKALVVGIANEYSIAYGCAKAFHELGAELAITYLNEKAKDYVEPLAKTLDAPIFMPLDVSQAREDSWQAPALPRSVGPLNQRFRYTNTQ